MATKKKTAKVGTVDQAHYDRATKALFGGLKDQIDSTRKFPRIGKVVGRAEQHGGVAIVTTCMHHSHSLALP